MRLQTKIQKNMILIILVTLAIAYAVTTLLVYRQTVDVMEKEVRQEAGYIRAAIEISGQGYLTELDAADKDTRITLITEQGEVLYDSDQAYEADLENHAGRPEVKEALQDGTGSNVRRSDTLNEEMINELDLNIPLENEMYEELTPLLKRIDEQNKQKDAIADMRKEFSANVSHELKTPLTSISGYAEIMKNGLVRPEDMKGFAERIYNEASRLITLVEDIIKLSKLDEGEIEMEKEDVDLYDLTRRIVSRLAPQAEKRAVHVEVTGENVICHGVRQILDEMIYNICENAIKYNRRGGSVSVWVGATLKGKKIIVTQERIFERFYRVDKSHSKETGGTGLGLSIVKHGAMLHNAQIHVESKVGKGTKMELTFS